jgi:endonuclease YncB( thermonuclease family)
MLAWRKKPDGFEWHQYIRTTIKVRREARRQRVVDARRAAGEQMNAAGAALVAGGKAAGSAAKGGAIAGTGAVALGLQAAWSIIVHWLGVLVQAIVNIVSRPNIGGPLGLAGAIALGAAFGRSRVVGFDGEAVLALAIGIVLMACLLPMFARSRNWRMPNVPGLSPKSAFAGAILITLAGGAAWIASGGTVGSFAGVANLPFVGGAKPLQGRAYATGPDTLRIGAANIKLTGIEIPEREQRCGTQGRSWRCGAASESALSRLVDGRSVSCTTSGSDEVGRKTGKCSIGDKDVAAELVRQGHVFADGTILSRYGSQEREARNAKAGLWSGGDVERPAAFRAKVWEEAKKRAPDGCPIKGQVAGSSRIYVLPWSPDYDRVRVQKARGERWFCSEQEAVSAGFKAAQRS